MREISKFRENTKYWFQTWKQFLVRMNGWYWVLSRKKPTSLESMKSLRNISSIVLRILFMWFVNPKSMCTEKQKKAVWREWKENIPACKNHRETARPWEMEWGAPGHHCPASGARDPWGPSALPVSHTKQLWIRPKFPIFIKLTLMGSCSLQPDSLDCQRKIQRVQTYQNL